MVPLKDLLGLYDLEGLQLLTCIFDELAQVLLHLLERRHVDVHHVPGFVIAHADIAAQGLVEGEMIESVFGGEVRRAEIVVAVGDEDLEIFVEGHRGA